MRDSEYTYEKVSHQLLRLTKHQSPERQIHFLCRQDTEFHPRTKEMTSLAAIANRLIPAVHIRAKIGIPETSSVVYPAEILEDQSNATTANHNRVEVELTELKEKN